MKNTFRAGPDQSCTGDTHAFLTYELLAVFGEVTDENPATKPENALTCENSRLRRNGSAYATGGPAG